MLKPEQTISEPFHGSFCLLVRFALLFSFSIQSATVESYYGVQNTEEAVSCLLRKIFVVHKFNARLIG